MTKQPHNLGKKRYERIAELEEGYDVMAGIPEKNPMIHLEKVLIDYFGKK